jgi:sugar fermentation stimulation protein A
MAMNSSETEYGMPLFGDIREGTFLDRPNRFVVRFLLDGLCTEAYLPNPGRLWELLLPGCTLYLIRNPKKQHLKLPFLALAVGKEKAPVLLHTHLTNQVVAHLIATQRLPGYEGMRIVKREITCGRSRFDFLLEKDGRPFLLEVKSCTLFSQNLAMFPDAVTVRGKRHLTELAELSRQGTPGGVLFLVSSYLPHFFLPDYHTDIDFARTFLALREDLMFKAISVHWRKDLTLHDEIRELVIPWDLLGREAKDSGNYLLILRLSADRSISVGRLGTVFFRKGYYLYVGSARTNLRKRLERHLRKKRKTFFWHIDYLRDQADACTAIPIRSSRPLEHELAASIKKISDWSVKGFGSSDCGCESHLFGMCGQPLHTTRFMEVLQSYRMDRLAPELGESFT